MLDLEVVPERSLGNEQWELTLGMPISQAISIMRRHCRAVKNIHLCYCDYDPLAMDIIMNLTDDGIRLVFDPHSQRLKIIEVYNLEKVKLKYCGVHFNSKTVSPTNDQIEMSFGATHPGVFDPANQQFILNFRGLSFFFPSNDKLEHNYSHGLGSLQFSNGPPVVSKLCIYMGNSLSETKAPPLPIPCYQSKCFSDKVLLIKDDRGKIQGITITIYGESGCSVQSESSHNSVTQDILFGDGCQAVMSALGAPCKIYYKDEDKMKIHSTSPEKQLEKEESDYFYNYFTLGLDILFDGKTHGVSKFVLHNNYPGHYDFNIYYRAYFELDLELDSETRCCVTSFTKWDQVEGVIGEHYSKPVVLNRRSSTNATNPFGPTFCYGFNSIIVEVMPSNNYVASVTIYT